MSRKKRKQQSSSEIQKQSSKGYVPLFSPDFKADLRWWYRNEPSKRCDPASAQDARERASRQGDKIMDLVADILDGNPFQGIGKPEPLKYIAADTWSRRIDLEHRLVYKVKNDKVYFLQARYHYQKD